MKNFKYREIEFDFNYTYDDLETVEKYDVAEKEMIAAISEIAQAGLGQADEIRQACIALTDFIDNVLGDGACNKALGEETSNTEIMRLKNTLQRYVAERMTEENTAFEVGLDREQGRKIK